KKEVNEAIVQEWFEAHPEVEPKLENLPDYFVTALELAPEEHVRVQAAIQRWVDSSISKTTNCPADWTVEQVEELYALARKLGCKGVTIYRDKSRDEQVLSRKEDAPAPKETQAAPAQAAAPAPAGTPATPPVNGNATLAAMRDASPTIGEVPEEVAGYTFRQKTMVGTARITINEKDGEPFETIIVLGKGGMDVTADSEAMGRLISLYLRTPSPVPNTKKLALVVEQLRGIGGAQPFGFGPNKVLSRPDALAKALERYLHRKVGGRPASDAVQESAAAREAPAGAPWAGAGNPAPPADPASYAHPAENGAPALPGADLCPACGSFSFIKAEGCGYCRNCGHSTC